MTALPETTEPVFSNRNLLSKPGAGRSIADHAPKHKIYSQGEPADAIFYVIKGKVKLSVISSGGKEAVIALLNRGEFFGEACLAGRSKRMSTATAVLASQVTRIEKSVASRLLRDDKFFADLFIRHLLARGIRRQEDLVDRLFNTSEKRLARVLLLMANFGKDGKQERVIGKISQQTLAETVGTTRARVSFFMNKFRRLGFIKYNGEIEVHRSLNAILRD